MNIELPRFEWYVHLVDRKWVSNVWTGSFGTRGSTGALSVPTFNYRLTVTDPGTDSAHFEACCYVSPPWNERSSAPPERETAYFDYYEDGLASASEWLDERLKRFNDSKDIS